jgi:hypothetical protein
MHIVPTAAVDDEVVDVVFDRASSRWNLIASLRRRAPATQLRRRRESEPAHHVRGSASPELRARPMIQFALVAGDEGHPDK